MLDVVVELVPAVSDGALATALEDTDVVNMLTEVVIMEVRLTLLVTVTAGPLEVTVKVVVGRVETGVAVEVKNTVVTTADMPDELDGGKDTAVIIVEL